MSGNSKKTVAKTKSQKALIIAAIVLGALLLALICYALYIWLNVSGGLGFDEGAVEDEYELDAAAQDLPAVEFEDGQAPMLEKPEGSVDIILIGVDNRDRQKFTGRSDTMMYLRIDKKQQQIKIASVMRDLLVKIDSNRINRINSAYKFGSIELLDNALRQNLGLQPDHFIVVNFFGMEDIVNTLGGVEVNVANNEIANLNKSINELNKLDPGNQSDKLSSAGKQILNGRQAVAYMRIRKVGGDASRISRQQTVIAELFKKIKGIGIGQIPAFLDAMVQYIRTDIPIPDIIDIATTLKEMENTDLNKFRYPDEFKYGNYNGMSIIQPKDYDSEIKKLHDFLSD